MACFNCEREAIDCIECNRRKAAERTIDLLTEELNAAKRHRRELAAAGRGRLLPGICAAIAEVQRLEDDIAIETARLNGTTAPARRTYIITAKEA